MNVVQQWSRDRLETALNLHWYGFHKEARELLEKIVKVVVKEPTDNGKEEEPSGYSEDTGGHIEHLRARPTGFECCEPARWSETSNSDA